MPSPDNIFCAVSLSYGFVGERKLSRFVLGIAAGVAALSALVLGLKMSGLLIFDGQMLHGRGAWSYVLQWGLAFLLTACSRNRSWRLSAIDALVGYWILVGSIGAFVWIRCLTFAESRRITDRHSFCCWDRDGVLLEPMADQVTLLGGRADLPFS
jgi:hypothetical protein